MSNELTGTLCENHNPDLASTLSNKLSNKKNETIHKRMAHHHHHGRHGHHHHVHVGTGGVVIGNRRTKPLATIISGVVSILIGLALGIAAIAVGALYAACIALTTNTSSSCSGITTPIVLGVIGIVLIVAGISSIIAGIRMFIIMKNIADGMSRSDLAAATTVTTPIPVATTTVQSTTTTVQPNIVQAGGYTSTPYYANQPPVGQPQPYYTPEAYGQPGGYTQQPYNPNQTYGQPQVGGYQPYPTQQPYGQPGVDQPNQYYNQPPTQPYGVDNKV